MTFPQKGWDLTFSLSHDLSKILYVNYPEGNYEICNICLYDLKTKQVDTLLKGGSLITDVYISNDNSHAYFLNASDNKNYSPIASQAPQGMDIFKITISSKIVRKITNLKAYSIQALTPTFSDSIITANIYDKQGLVMISTNTGDVEQVMINSPRNPVQEYFIPIDVRSDSMIYEAPYELYKHNIKTNKSDLILRCPDGNQFGVIQPDNNWSNILFNSGDKMYFYNVPNKN